MGVVIFVAGIIVAAIFVGLLWLLINKADSELPTVEPVRWETWRKESWVQTEAQAAKAKENFEKSQKERQRAEAICEELGRHVPVFGSNKCARCKKQWFGGAS